MKLYAILKPEIDGNFLFVEKCSINKETVKKELNEIISIESKGLSYIALAEFNINTDLCDLTKDYIILEEYLPQFGSYGKWIKKL